MGNSMYIYIYIWLVSKGEKGSTGEKEEEEEYGGSTILRPGATNSFTRATRTAIG